MSSFHELGLTLTETISKAFDADGISAPTPVQAEAIAPILKGIPVVMHSGTGTGKTLAYVLPLLQKLAEDDGLRAVVFAPGAELAMQTHRVIQAYKPEALPTAAAITTSNKRRQRKRITKSTRLIVGTPDRLIALFKTGKLKGVRQIVFDELDPILASRDATFLDVLLSRSEPKVQLVVASATLGKRSEAFISRFMEGHQRVQPSSNPFDAAIAHQMVPIAQGRAKDVALARFIEREKCRPAIVFVSDPGQQRHLFRYLGEHGLNPVTVGREGSKGQRQRGLDDFRAGRARVLLTTDAIARGLDIPEVPWVLHYDVPLSAPAYVHRAGRTGRAGREGRSVLFVDAPSRGLLRRLERSLGREFERL